MLVVVGLSLKNLQPHVWDESSPYYVPGVGAVMVSYADFHAMPARRRAAMSTGLHRYLGVPEGVKVYLDNGAFYFLKRQGETLKHDYEEFVAQARPDWWPIPQDFIPSPHMTIEEQQRCLDRTMSMNLAYQHDGYVPIIHISRVLEQYIVEIGASPNLTTKPRIGLGGIVPNLLRAPKAMPYGQVIHSLRRVRQVFADKELHLFGVGGTATMHLAALLDIDTVDSSGWRNRAARGIVQLPGSGDRLVADLGSWRGRKPSTDEWGVLRDCPCSACQAHGVTGLGATGIGGFCNRATHNLWVLLNEVSHVEAHLADGTYATWYEQHLDNSIYLQLVRHALEQRTHDRL